MMITDNEIVYAWNESDNVHQCKVLNNLINNEMPDLSSHCDFVFNNGLSNIA